MVLIYYGIENTFCTCIIKYRAKTRRIMHINTLFLLAILFLLLLLLLLLLICVMPVFHHPFLMHIFSPYMQRLQAAK